MPFRLGNEWAQRILRLSGHGIKSELSSRQLRFFFRQHQGREAARGLELRRGALLRLIVRGQQRSPPWNKVGRLSSGIVTFIFHQVIRMYLAPDTLVSYTIVSYVNSLVVLSVTGVAHGSQPLISCYYGRGDRPAGGKPAAKAACACPTRLFPAREAWPFCFEKWQIYTIDRSVIQVS